VQHGGQAAALLIGGVDRVAEQRLALDAGALDEALGELERRAQAGRLVAVVSHIRTVAERIEDVLQVVQEPEGTDVTRVSGAEREAFVEEEIEERLLA
jgi:exonuclease SbcC